jgi:hypothetical protein
MYTDAHVAEALHCHPGRHLWQVLGPFPPAHTVFQHRLRMNGFLSRWLEYLASRGIPAGTLERQTDDGRDHQKHSTKNPRKAGFPFSGGVDGTRTRDLRRDRPAF